ncbi:hypothetical protein [Rossellomorea vietnamensis]|uniref:hypothetical protein n=1 Tax=Rossellomorea vietnamensis TaxID=218284 RepID=UPI003D2A6DBD
MTLLENAYDFLHNSLFFYHLATHEEYPKDYKRFWKFSLVNLVQALELLFKELLVRENKILVYENIDKPKHTVSVTTALNRLKNIVNIDIDTNDETIIKKAIDLRNYIMHYGIELDIKELTSIYIVLFEFLHSFHHRFLDQELHENIHPQYWEEEALLMEQFKREFVLYNGIEIHKDFAIEIAESQLFTTVSVEGVEYKRVKFGEEADMDVSSLNYQSHCGDCAVKQGYFHAIGCDLERCPKCNDRALGCECNLYEDFFNEDSN